MTTPEIPISKSTLQKHIENLKINMNYASIREVNRLISVLEKDTGLPFIRMEFGIPGLAAQPIGVQAEIDALTKGQVANKYAPFDGVPILKEASAEFCKAFLNISVKPENCVPTCGAMQGGFIAMAIAGKIKSESSKIVFLDPGFPVNKFQADFLGLETVSLDFYSYRGKKLISKLEELLSTGDIGGVLWSNPNNPTWICFTEEETEGIGKLLTKYDVIGIEDLAYFGMDFRKDYGKPYQPPYQPTVSHYTDNYIILLSSSKIFSYAGQRIAVTIISPALMNKKSPYLQSQFNTDRIGHAYVHGGMYSITAGVAESPQYALAAMMKAANEGRFDFLKPLKEYAERAMLMKKAFLNNGFKLVYDNDLGEPLGNGFYFTISYPGFGGTELMTALISYGISSITLKTTGSIRTEGLRACVSLTSKDMISVLEERLQKFHNNQKVKN